jgi:SPP1 gp7 family putative phage head morphogenesis protein
MCFLEQKKWSRDEICACFGVPKAELSVYEDINYATARSADKSFWQKTLIPIMRLIEATLRAQFFIPYDGEKTWLKFDLSVIEALQQDYKEKLAQAKTLFDMGFPPNQINEKLDLGFEELPWGDVGYLPMGLIEAGTEPPAVKAAGIVSEPPPEKAFKVKDKTPHTPQQAIMWKQFERTLSGPERQFKEKVRLYLNRVKKWLTGQLSAFDRPQDIPIDALKLSEEWDDELKTLAAKHYEKVSVSYGPVIEEDLRAAGISYKFNRNDPRLVDYLRIKENKIVGINDRMRKTVSTTIAEGVRQNQTVTELQNSISTVMGETKKRSLVIARTETASAANGLEFECFKQAGVKSQLWLAALDETTRDTHIEAMAMGPQPMGQIFGPTGCRYPGDENGAPEEIINCRCTLMAVE